MRLKFWKKEERPKEEEVEEEPEQAERPEQSGEIQADFNKLKIKVDTLDDIRKATAERLAHVSEQIGELRGMILDVNRAASSIEIKMTKTNDLVEAVQPDKLMMEVRRTDGKIEAVKANIESNEAMMKTLMAEVKDLRNKMAFFRGIDQVVKLNDDIKKELSQIEKTKAVIERHADKSETIFSEMQNRFSDLDKFSSQIKELVQNVKQLNDAADTLKVQMAKKADKQELEKLIKKFDEFELHVGNVIDLMGRKAKDFNEEFKVDVAKFQQMFEIDLKKGKKTLELIENLAQASPNLAANLKLVKAIEQTEEEQEKLKKVEAVIPQKKKKAWFLPGKKDEKSKKPA